MKSIVVVDKNWGIGKDNDLLTYLPNDLKYFKRNTIGKVVVMGKNTLLSLPKQKPFVDRINIVLTRDKEFECEGAFICNSLDDLFEELKKYNKEDIFIAGGESIYNQLIDYCDEILVTKIDATYPADKFFPNLDNMKQWKITEKSEIQEEKNTKYVWCKYKKYNN